MTKGVTWRVLQSLWLLCRSGSTRWIRWRRRQHLHIGDDGVDLVWVEMVLEARHVRRAVADDLAHHGFLAAERVLRQVGAVFGGRRDLQLHVAHHAGLIEQIAALQLLGSQRVGSRKRLRRRSLNARGEHQPGHPSTAPHAASSLFEVVAYFLPCYVGAQAMKSVAWPKVAEHELINRKFDNLALIWL